MIKYSQKNSRIETERLILRPIERKDVADIVKNINDLRVSKWLLVVPYPYGKKQALFWINSTAKHAKQKPRKEYGYGIELKEEGKIIGGISLHISHQYSESATIGYWLGVKYHGKGYGSEALEALIDLAFKKIKLKRLEAGVFTGNPSSGKLLEKFSFRQEGYRRKAMRCKADGKIKDEYIYGLLRSEYQNPMKHRKK
jgi:ribosomal-protein-alanine N-acetyltransferase